MLEYHVWIILFLATIIVIALLTIILLFYRCFRGFLLTYIVLVFMGLLGMHDSDMAIAFLDMLLGVSSRHSLS